jgi:protein-S-isoprenylcysteine O-methyltransferase Ste14
MHGIKETSNTLRIVWFVSHSIFLYIAYLICFDDKLLWLDSILDVDFQGGNFYRRCCLWGFGVLMYIRMNLTTFHLLKRKMPIEELFGVIIGCAVYQIGFVLLGGWQSSPLSLLDVFGILLFIIGSYINTYSEIQRKRFKDDPNNNGKLYTQGLFKYARHINYFGDICWVTGWAIVTNNIWSMFIPISLTLGFIFLFIPELSRYLETNYVDEYLDWKKQTKKLIPFIY